MSSATPNTSPEEDDLPYADSPQQISAAPHPPHTTNEDEEDDDFEFAFAVTNTKSHPSITADELFSDGQIRPIYPVFNRDLLLADHEEKLRRQPLLQLLIEDRNASSSNSSSPLEHDLRGIAPDSYCVWKPGAVRKSPSTGSPRRRRFRDLVVGRSQSDGKEKFMFFAAEEKSVVAKEGAVCEGKKKGKEKLDLMSAHRMFYGLSAAGSTPGTGSVAGRKSYLPYKPEIVGFFARVHGISRAHHPF